MTSSTKESSYTERLVAFETVWWKRLFDVQAPYRWNLRRLNLGFCLDLGCGLGRNLVNLGSGVGVDHNPHSIEVARARGLEAFTPETFRQSRFHAPGTFDTLLLSHVAEHMQPADVVALVSQYLPLLKPSGRVVFITPQEAGQASDATHLCFMDFAQLRTIARDLGLDIEREFSFPFPRAVGKIFKYNEFVAVTRLASQVLTSS